MTIELPGDLATEGFFAIGLRTSIEGKKTEGTGAQGRKVDGRPRPQKLAA
jgi:hypothetical protein